jgi:hypothetical protein
MYVYRYRDQGYIILTPQKEGSLSGFYDYSLNPYIGCAFQAIEEKERARIASKPTTSFEQLKLHI